MQQMISSVKVFSVNADWLAISAERDDNKRGSDTGVINLFDAEVGSQVEPIHQRIFTRAWKTIQVLDTALAIGDNYTLYRRSL